MTFIPQFKYTLDTIKDISSLQDSPFKTHRRLKVFAEKGCVCVSCGAKGTILARGIDKAKSKHWDVYTEDFLPLTVDHIFPKSKGGSNDLKNLQPMCYTCNQLKSDKTNDPNYLP